jgi:hypothetical protein
LSPLENDAGVMPIAASNALHLPVLQRCQECRLVALLCRRDMSAGVTLSG